MLILEQELEAPAAPDHRDLLNHFSSALRFRFTDGTIPVRFAVTRSGAERYRYEVGILKGLDPSSSDLPDSIFRFVPRKIENTTSFNAVFLVPTGIGADIGGHAGDAAPAAKLLAETCDVLVTHPNVVNASDINELPDNALYVEGSVISRLMMGTLGLRPVRANRVLVIIDAHPDELFTNAAINAVSAARASYGLQCPSVVQLDPPLRMKSSYTSSGRAAGEIEGLDRLCAVLDEHAGDFDAVAISSVIDVPSEFHDGYFQSDGDMVNPWGGVEAMLTHAVSSLYDIPSAHSPMFESRDIANMDPGIVEPRMAAEAVSLTFFQCILKGLQRSPRIVADRDAMTFHGVMTVADISCLVIPDGCVGLPTLAALEQAIPVIAVRENKNVMRNDLTALPWRREQLHIVDNYWEAVGVMTALKAGISPASVRRPLAATDVKKTTRTEKRLTPGKDQSATRG
jgi:hypothetical protein